MNTIWFIKRALIWLYRFSKYRNGLLIVGGALYVIGYSVWTFYAFWHRLGLLPGLRAQYFMAGAVPAGILFVAYIAYQLIIRPIKLYFAPPVPAKQRGLRDVLTGVVPMIILVFVIGALIVYRLKLIPWIPANARRHPALALSAAIVFAIYVIYEDRLIAFVHRPAVRLGLLFLFTATCLVLYVAFFGFIPQELGGLHPECAYLHILKDKASSRVLKALSPIEGQPQDNVVRSAQVDVLFPGGDFMLIRPRSARGARGHIELRKDMIEAVVSCDYDD